MRLVKTILLAAALSVFGIGGATAQGCGTGNPGCVAPTAPTTPTCDNSNKIANTAFVKQCGASGVAGVSSISNADGSLNFSANTGPVTASLNTAHSNT